MALLNPALAGDLRRFERASADDLIAPQAAAAPSGTGRRSSRASKVGRRGAEPHLP